VWIASNKQLFEVHGSRCDVVASQPSPIPPAYRDPSGTLWFGTQESLVELVGEKPKSLPLPDVHAMTS
jgi:hypothetical protein